MTDLLVLYGTQTNTAKSAANEIGREATRRNLKPKIMAMDEFNIMQLPTAPMVVFIVATTGEGEAPQTMQKAWKFLLRSDLPPTSLAKVKFTCFGLGDSTYALFNALAKKLTSRMLQLGANLFHKVGLGDYQHDFGYEGEFDPWLQQMWPNLKTELEPTHPMLLEPIAFALLEPIYKVTSVSAG